MLKKREAMKIWVQNWIFSWVFIVESGFVSFRRLGKETTNMQNNWGKDQTKKTINKTATKTYKRKTRCNLTLFVWRKTWGNPLNIGKNKTGKHAALSPKFNLLLSLRLDVGFPFVFLYFYCVFPESSVCWVYVFQLFFLKCCCSLCSFMFGFWFVCLFCSVSVDVDSFCAISTSLGMGVHKSTRAKDLYSDFARNSSCKWWSYETGWCLQPLWKILVSWDDYSQYMEK